MNNYICYLLSYVKFGDQDAVLHCFSETTGFKSFFVKGIYSAKNKKKPYLFPLNLLELTTSNTRKQNSIPLVSKIALAPGFDDFNDVKVNTILFFVADFLHQILREEDGSKSAFLEIQKFKDQITLNNYNSYIALIFNFLKISGIAPLFSDKVFLHPETGTFGDETTHFSFSADLSAIWKRYLQEEDNYLIKLNRAERNAFLDSLMIYYKRHFTGFYLPNSLDVLRQIYS